MAETEKMISLSQARKARAKGLTAKPWVKLEVAAPPDQSRYQAWKFQV